MNDKINANITADLVKLLDRKTDDKKRSQVKTFQERKLIKGKQINILHQLVRWW